MRYVFAMTAGLALMGSTAMAAITPVYQVTENDATWTHMGSGVYTVPTSAEDYANEVWERPIQDDKWSDAGGTRTSGTTDDGGEYWAYADLASASWGVGSSMGADYLFVRWEVVGDFKHIAGETNPVTEGLKGHYYFYARPAGGEAFAIEVNDATGLDADFDDSDNDGKVKIYNDLDGDVSGSGVTVTQEGGNSFGDSTVAGEVRADDVTFVVEVAVELSDLGLTLGDFTAALDWAYAGVAVSNPSDPNSDLFVNDFFPEAPGSGAQYDSVRLGTLIPEPASAALLGLAAGLPLLGRRRRPGH